MDRNFNVNKHSAVDFLLMASLKPPGAIEFWLYLTFENPIYFCLMKYFTLSDLIKLVLCNPAIGRFFQSNVPVLPWWSFGFHAFSWTNAQLG